jgi:hypothetical protein
VADRVRVLSTGGDPRDRSPVSVGAALAVLAALIIGAAVGRLSSPGDSGTSPPSAKALSRPAAPAAGPSRTVTGVGAGYARTRGGAVTALLNDSAVLGDPRTLLNPKRRTAVLKLIATDRYAATFKGRGGAALDQARQGLLGRGLAAGAQTIYLASPVAYRVLSFSPTRVVVRGWGVSVVGNDQGLAPRASWATTTTQAVWQDGDWKIDTVRSTDGPTPALAGQSPSTAAVFLNELTGTQGVHHAP